MNIAKTLEEGLGSATGTYFAFYAAAVDDVITKEAATYFKSCII